MGRTESAGVLSTRARHKELDREDLLQVIASQEREISSLRNRVDHLSEAMEHYQRQNRHHRREMESAIVRAQRERAYRRVLAREWAASGSKVRVLARSLEVMRQVYGEKLEIERMAKQNALAHIAACRSHSSGIGL